MPDCEREAAILRKVLTSRNKLVNQLMELPSLTDSQFQEMVALRRANWDNDRKLLEEVDG